MDLEKTLLRKVGEAIHRFDMIRAGDRLAVAVSGGKDSVTMLEVLLLLQKRAPIDFSICAFTIEQGKFLAPVAAVGEYITKSLKVDWTYHTDNPSLRLLEDQPDHGCDLCSRFRRRAVYQIARSLGANYVRALTSVVLPVAKGSVVASALFAFLPSGLVLYYVMNTGLGVLQQWNINRRITVASARKT